MKILFTGASSFTGMWFIKALAEAGHEVTSILLRPFEKYEGLRQSRVEIVKQHSVKIVEECPFGSEKFMGVIEEKKWDILCHHAAEVTNYKDDHFDYLNAVKKNTHNLQKVIETLKNSQCKKIVLTGSVFEQREGLGEELSAISPYGLSKGITSDIFAYYCKKNEITLKKFIIANPFGPYEEERFTTYLIKKWAKQEKATVSYPLYIRDNIPVSFLSILYRYFVEEKIDSCKITPSYFVESMSAFTQRFANEMSMRLSLKCEFNSIQQADYQEPMSRYGVDSCENIIWNEKSFWDKLAEYYQKFYISEVT